mmetsp:Transcript_3131/g.4580  ORF Transcript_3131/g.4580 Transcript_3131/m.4580 type:complete len:111 (-) Transcript_3131:75-407(-)
MVVGTINRDECKAVHSVLGDAGIPKGCLSMLVNPQDSFENEKDSKAHRNSWLWPRLARRMTKGSGKKYHPSQVEQEPVLEASQCQEMLAALKAKLGDEAKAKSLLPKACA